MQEAWSDFVGKIVPAGAEPPVIEVREPTAAISAAGKAMPLLGPVFSVEADLQALHVTLLTLPLRRRSGSGAHGFTTPTRTILVSHLRRPR